MFMLDYGSYSHGCPFANTQKMDLQSDQKKDGSKKGDPFSNWSKTIFKLIEVCKVKLPKSNVRIVFVNISSLLALQAGSSCLLLIPGPNVSQVMPSWSLYATGKAWAVGYPMTRSCDCWWWGQSVWRVNKFEEIAEIAESLGETNEYTKKEEEPNSQGGGNPRGLNIKGVPRWYWYKCKIFSGGVLKWGVPQASWGSHDKHDLDYKLRFTNLWETILYNDGW